jgi:SAM-dependent methyltransferase
MISNIGPGESPDPQRLRAEIERLGPWHHDVEVAPGVTTMGVRDADDPDLRFEQHYSPAKMMRHLFGTLYPDGFEGRSFLDCACNSGGHSIEAARRGAGRGFAFDARQHWIDQAQFLARHCGAPELTVRRCELSDLPALGLEPFDVTLFAGIFYHLPDPVVGLKIAADLTRELIVVNTAVLPRRDPALVLNIESDTHVLSGVDRVAWLPSGPRVMQELLAWCGFKHSRIDLYWTYNRIGWKRLQIVAARDEKVFAAYDRVRPDAIAPPTLLRRSLFRLYRLLNRS